MPTVPTPSSQLSRICDSSSMRCDGTPRSRVTSTSRCELDEFAEPITSTRSTSRASDLTAAWRLVVA